MKETISDQAFQDAADHLGCEEAAVRAVAEVESRGAPFLPDGRPTILFERHKFHKFTDGKFDQSHPDLSNPKAGGYGKAGAHQWDRYEEASTLDAKAAMLSCSWGAFQIMGFNHSMCGFDSVEQFVDAMGKSADWQLAAFVMFVKSAGLADDLRNKRWTAFARAYNGKDYHKNDYHAKLARAYARWKTSAVKAPPVDELDPPVVVDEPEPVPGTDPPLPLPNPKAGAPVPPDAATTGEAVVGGRPQDPSKQVTTGGTPTRIAIGGGAILAALSSVWNYLSNRPNTAVVGIVCVTVLILAFVFRQALLDYVRMKLAASPDKYNVK